MATIEPNESLQLILQKARDLAIINENPELTDVHLFVASLHLRKGAVGGLLAEMEEQAKQLLYQEAENALSRLPKRPNVSQLYFARNYERTLLMTARLAEEDASTEQRPEHLFLALLKDDSVPAHLAKRQKITFDQAIVKFQALKTERRLLGLEDERRDQLLRFGTDLTERARLGLLDPVIGRENEIEQMVRILLRRTKNNPVLVGEPGTGKSAIVEGLATKIARGEVPTGLKNRMILQLDASALVAGTKYRGEFERRLKLLLNIVADSRQEVILFIDELHTIVGSGNQSGGMDMANMLKPMLARGEILLIGATTLDEYRNYIEIDGALERRFQKVMVRETDGEATLSILEGIRPVYQLHHHVEVRDEALQAAVRFAQRYVADRRFPDKAIDLLDESCSMVKMREGKVVDEEDVAMVIAKWTGIPVSRVTQDESQRFLALDKTVAARFVGQKEAVLAIRNAIVRSRSGLDRGTRPIGSFLLTGSTGVGKTWLASCIADALFEGAGSFICFDMSEYMEKNAVAKLIGAPPGYVGHEEGGALTEAIRRSPYAVVLFDEVEKASPEIFQLFLQILESGRLTDNRGRIADFRNAIILMTSNLTSEKELHQFFRQEFLHRLDAILPFKALLREDLLQIARLQMEEIVTSAASQELELTYDEELLTYLVARAGVDENGQAPFGARPLRRIIQDVVTTKISELILTNGYQKGVRCHIAMPANWSEKMDAATTKNSEEEWSAFALHTESEALLPDYLWEKQHD